MSMRMLIVILLAFAVIGMGCESTPPAPASDPTPAWDPGPGAPLFSVTVGDTIVGEPWWVEDTSRVIALEAMAFDLNNRLTELNVQPKVLHVPMFSPEDSLEYYLLDDTLVKITLRLGTTDAELWQDHYLQDGQRYMARHRQWFRRYETSGSGEVLVYWDDTGDLFFSRERRGRIPYGEPPAAIRRKKWKPTNRVKEVVENEFDYFYAKGYAAVQEDLNNETVD